MKGVRKILVAVNNSLDGVREGIRLTGEEKAWLTVLKVFPAYEGELNLTGIKNIREVLVGEQRQTEAAIKELARQERTLIKTRIAHGEIAATIVAVAREERCDLIIMGAQKSNFWVRLFGRNIVEKVVSAAPCPVFVVGHEEEVVAVGNCQPLPAVG
jgi:nucleotide-binding universal stress UspA family protein